VLKLHSTRLILAACLASSAPAAWSLNGFQPSTDSGSRSYVVFLQSRPIGREEVSITRVAGEWIVRGSSRIGQPVDTVTRSTEIRYTEQWHPTRFALEGSNRGQEIAITTTFADGKANNEITVAGKTDTKSDAVSPDAVVLPNTLLTSYSVLAHRLAGAKPGDTFPGYIVPQIEVPISVAGINRDRVETPQRVAEATRYTLIVKHPNGELRITLWGDADGSLLRLSVPAQGLELAREDIASAAARTTSFSLPTDEAVRIPANGFNLAGSVAKPVGATAKLPAVLLVGGSGPTDRDETVFGVPVMGHIAAALVDAGFLVARYDKRGIGQSGGRAESSTITDFVEDGRAGIAWLVKRPDVDKERIAIVGHSEGAWVALTVAARDKRIAAVTMIAGPSMPGTDVVLEQQAHLFEQMKTPDAERQEKAGLQKRIHDAVLGRGSWDGIPADLRKQAETPWFHSYLTFDPIKTMKDVRQPILIVQGELDTQVPPHHADKLAEAARARKRKAGVDIVKVPGVNHLLVPAKTGEVTEYGTLSDNKVSPAVTSAISLWLAKTLGPAERK
jgi:pimeloyl-ACP methyl ester carboxylesterase